MLAENMTNWWRAKCGNVVANQTKTTFEIKMYFTSPQSTPSFIQAIESRCISNAALD